MELFGPIAYRSGGAGGEVDYPYKMINICSGPALLALFSVLATPRLANTQCTAGFERVKGIPGSFIPLCLLQLQHVCQRIPRYDPWERSEEQDPTRAGDRHLGKNGPVRVTHPSQGLSVLHAIPQGNR